MIGILNYGLGNIKAFENIYRKNHVPVKIVSQEADLSGVERLILPGVGAFDHAMLRFNESGLRSAVEEMVLIQKVPVIGICVGMQMLFSSSVESPGAAGLAVIHGTVELIEGNVRRPQMQWNELHVENEDPLFAGLPKTPWVYFVHSYSAVPTDSSVVVATCEYGRNLTAVVRQENVVATQFHPEKSAKDGLKLLHNFVSSCS
mgnify:CR=1 FL=1